MTRILTFRAKNGIALLPMPLFDKNINVNFSFCRILVNKSNKSKILHSDIAFYVSNASEPMVISIRIVRAFGNIRKDSIHYPSRSSTSWLTLWIEMTALTAWEPLPSILEVVQLFPISSIFTTHSNIVYWLITRLRSRLLSDNSIARSVCSAYTEWIFDYDCIGLQEIKDLLIASAYAVHGADSACARPTRAIFFVFKGSLWC